MTNKTKERSAKVTMCIVYSSKWSLTTWAPETKAYGRYVQTSSNAGILARFLNFSSVFSSTTLPKLEVERVVKVGKRNLFYRNEIKFLDQNSRSMTPAKRITKAFPLTSTASYICTALVFPVNDPYESTSALMSSNVHDWIEFTGQVT